jgi:predicted transcriptional regulator
MPATDESSWTFLTNHAHVLVCIHRDPEIRLRDVATLVGITERAAQKIVADLSDAGYVKVERLGRRNTYTIAARRPLRHPLENNHNVGELLGLLEHGRSAKRAPK